ncbi:MAG: hypothetical protein ACRCU0_07250 [Candidatus Rhabdochlamydia sp.]
MTQIILSSAAWYIVPKGIEYLTSKPSSLDSRVDRIRATFFSYKSTLNRLVHTNPLTEGISGLASIYYSNMWLAILIAPGFQKIIPLKGFDYLFWRTFTCHILFVCKLTKPDCIKFMNSDTGLDYITSKQGLRLVNIILSLGFTKTYLLSFIKSHLPECLASDQLISILDKRLKHSDTYDLLRATYSSARSEEDSVRFRAHRLYDASLTPLSRVRFYDPSARDELFHTIFSDIARENNIRRVNELDDTLRIEFSEHYGDGLLIEAGISIIDRIKACRKYIANMQSVLRELPYYAEDIFDTDPILNQIQCPISLRSIRRTITDPTNKKIVYDYETFKIWLKHKRTSPITREEIPESFDITYEGGSRYDSIMRYRKACLQSKQLQDPEKFITNLKQIFTEISALDDANDIKDASEIVRTFFQKGVLNVYDTSYLNTSDSYKIFKKRHTKDLNERKEEAFKGISIEDFEQYPFMIKEINLEIEKIKLEGQELIKEFL